MLEQVDQSVPCPRITQEGTKGLETGLIAAGGPLGDDAHQIVDLEVIEQTAIGVGSGLAAQLQSRNESVELGQVVLAGVALGRLGALPQGLVRDGVPRSTAERLGEQASGALLEAGAPLRPRPNRGVE